MPNSYRPRLTGPETPTDEMAEGLRAAWWRERVLEISRPKLAELLGVSAKTVTREEQRSRVSTEYRLACAALDAELAGWSWKSSRPDRSARKVRRRV
jgi:hypothetical protein